MKNQGRINAQIKKTFLGKEDHGIPTLYIHVEYEGVQQGFGGYDLRFKDYHTMPQDILDVLEVSCWEKLPGTYVRIVRLSETLTSIGHITKEKFFTPLGE